MSRCAECGGRLGVGDTGPVYCGTCDPDPERIAHVYECAADFWVRPTITGEWVAWTEGSDGHPVERYALTRKSVIEKIIHVIEGTEEEPE